MASLGGEQQILLNNPAADISQRPESREGSAERKGAVKERDEKLKFARERQNEERQRKIEELKAQAEAAQRYREQKEEERRRRIEEIRHRDSEKRQQVEERKKAIMEAEKERREYILRKNQERESRLESKKRERNSIGYAFGSSTPRLLEPADFGMVSPSTFWGQRRSTSISNVANATLSRRSSERELNDSGSKKRATSASGTERHDGHRRKSTSMYEVFNWNDEPPKRFSLSIIGSEINIDEPPAAYRTTNHNQYNRNVPIEHHRQYSRHNFSSIATSPAKEDSVDTSPVVFRSVARRKTDLMPTIPSPREGQQQHFGSRSSLSTPRTPGRAYSMNRLDQLAQPVRRNGEHIHAILERERREQLELMLDDVESLGEDGVVRRSSGTKRKTRGGNNNNNKKSNGSMSRSMTHLAGSGGIQPPRFKYNIGGGISTSFLPLGSGSKIASKSMLLLGNGWSSSSTTPRSNLGLQTAATKKYLLQASLVTSCTSNTTKRGQLHYTNITNTTNTTTTNTTSTTTNPYRFDTDSLLLMNSPSLFLKPPGSRSGNVTPGGHLNNSSRPGSAMSTSTTLSTTTAGLINRRSLPAVRKPRPASIAGTGVSLEEINKLKKEQKPPVKSATPTVLAQTTPKRSTNLMSTSLIVTPTTRLFTPEKKTPPMRRDPVTPKVATPKPLSKTGSSDRLNKLSKEKSKDIPSTVIKPPISTTVKSVTNNNKTTTTTTTTSSIDNKELSRKSKEEKEAINQVKTEEISATTATVLEVAQVTVKSAQEEQNGAKNANSTVISSSQEEEKIDIGSEKEKVLNDITAVGTINQQQQQQHKLIDNNDNSDTVVIGRELNVMVGGGGGGDGTDSMTASMIAKSKITTEEEAKAALAERRRLAREEAERQAELERQRLEAERLAELKRQEEEAERQRQFEEEAMRLAEEQRKAEDERLRQAIEEAKQREEEEKRKREEEERQRLEREEAEKKAKEEAEKQRIEVAERLKREEKEREERRKRVEAIMSRTRRSGTNATPNSTPTKENNNTQDQKTSVATANNTANDITNATDAGVNLENTIKTTLPNSSDSNSTSGSSSATATTPTTLSTTATDSLSAQTATIHPNNQNNKSHSVTVQNSQALYEQSVIDKENSLINSFSNLILDENMKNIQQKQQQQHLQNQFMVEQSNHTTKLVELQKSHEPVANGNGHHIDIINNKNENDLMKTVVVPTTNQLIDLTMDSHHDNMNFNNNNSLLSTTTTTPTTTLVTADSHESKDISLL